MEHKKLEQDTTVVEGQVSRDSREDGPSVAATAPATPRASTVRPGRGLSRVPTPFPGKPPRARRSRGASQLLKFSQTSILQVQARRACLWPKREGKARRFELFGTHREHPVV